MPESTTETPQPPTPPTATPDPNPVVAGYRIGPEMGKGPLGKIYRAEDVDTGAKVVFRGFTRPEGADPARWEAAKEQFRELLSSQQRIDRHPVIQDIIGFGEEEGLFWIATEYFEGRTLQQIMASEGAKPISWCVEVMKQVADAVDFAAEHDLVHTDLTPYNILLVRHEDTPDRVDVRVINFGLGHARPKHGSRYAAPEQHDGFGGDRRSDVYAVGVLLLELLTGKPVFTGTTAEEIAQKSRTEDPTRSLVSMPSYVRNVLGAMLHKAPRFRYATVGGAVDDLANKRSPDGADRHDGVEMNTDALLAERKLERRKADTAQDALRETWNDADERERFRHLEIGDAPVRVPGSGKLGTDAGAHGRLALQDYRLSEMDLLEIKWKAERDTRRQETEREEARERWQPVAKWGILVAGFVLLLAHAGAVVPGYRSARVIATEGETVRLVAVRDPDPKADAPKPKPLKKGEVLTKDDLPLYIMTDARGSATLSLANGEAIYIPSDSAVELLDLDYANGPVRKVTLWRGRMAVRTGTVLRGKEQFTLTTDGGVTCDAAANSRLSMESGKQDGWRFLRVATPMGAATVEFGSKIKLKAGEEVLLRIPGGGGGAQPIPPSDTSIAKDEKALAAAPDPHPVVRLFAAAEENAVLPVLELAKNIAAIPTGMNDSKNIAVATASMQALCSLMATGEEGGAGIETLNLETLAPLSLPEKDRDRILSSFQDKKLTKYRLLPKGGYELLARAKDSKHTWIRGKNGAASTAGTGKIPTQ